MDLLLAFESYLIHLKQNAMIKYLFKFTIQPNSSKNQICGLYGEPARIKIKIQSPPVEGAANKELIKFLSKALKTPKTSIEIIRGETSKNKDLLVLADESDIEHFLKEHSLDIHIQDIQYNQ